MPAACRTCGTVIIDSPRTHCDDCLRDFRIQQQADFAHAGPRTLAVLRHAGTDPAHDAIARERRAKTMRRHHRQAATGVHEPADSDLFTREILPTIQTVPLEGLAAATGLSLRYVSLIRRGERVPHPRHWPAFRMIATGRDGC